MNQCYGIVALLLGNEPNELKTFGEVSNANIQGLFKLENNNNRNDNNNNEFEYHSFNSHVRKQSSKYEGQA